MGCITGILLSLSVGVLIAFDVFFWSVSWVFGLIGILAIITFVIAYAVAENFALSPRDHARNSEWGVFRKKIGWAWSITLMVCAAVTFIVFLIVGW